MEISREQLVRVLLMGGTSETHHFIPVLFLERLRSANASILLVWLLHADPTGTEPLAASDEELGGIIGLPPKAIAKGRRTLEKVGFLTTTFLYEDGWNCYHLNMEKICSGLLGEDK